GPAARAGRARRGAGGALGGPAAGPQTRRWRLRPPAGPPPGVPLPPVVGRRFAGLPWRARLGRRGLRGPWTRPAANTAQRRLGDTPSPVGALSLAAPPLARPAPGGLGWGPAGLRHPQGEGGWRAPPGGKVLPDRTGARPARPSMALGCQTYAQRA